ncbi:SDR family NAD(P)-dependent oxidoreductase [Kitasatospora cineracea]|uniref:SDR family NAD(P)-dependent oxidoreductase n=1 Tax=Kitasatospora cineracea TaxID=88074 RepID=UPI0038178892
MPIDPAQRTVLVAADPGAAAILAAAFTGTRVLSCAPVAPAVAAAFAQSPSDARPTAAVLLADPATPAGRRAATDTARALPPGGVLVLVGTAGTERQHLTAAVREILATVAPAVRVHAVHTADGSVEPLAPLAAHLTTGAAAALDTRTLEVGTPLPRPAAARAEAARAEAAEDAVVVVGMGLAVPGASTPEEFWSLLTEGEPVFGEPGERIDLGTVWSPDPAVEDKTYARVSGFMTGFTPHPTLRAEIESGAFAAEEYTALWLRHSLLGAVEGVAVRPEDRQLFAVGLTPDGSQHLEHTLVTAGTRRLLDEAGLPVPEAGLAARYPLAAGAPDEVLPYRIARAAVPDLPADAEIVVVDTACSSSLYTIDIGVRALRAGEADVALCGGAFALTTQNLVLFSKLRGLSKSGRVRSLDRGADGVLFSDGAAVLALKTHRRALADGDRVLGFVAGFGGSSDGRGKAIYAPNPAGQQIALRRAWDAAGAEPQDVDWVVAHATGTPTGDRTEFGALTAAAPGREWTMTSNKSLVGHAGWAAGAVSAVHALLALDRCVIPGQRQFDGLPDGTADVRVPTADLPWPVRPDGRRTVGVSAMGFGGTNGHLLLTDRPPAAPVRPAPAGTDPVVVVATGAHLPGDPDRARLDAWLSGADADWPAGFGDAYPLPSPVEARLAPTAIAAMDRSQLMALRCADLIAGPWLEDRELADRAGVFVGHSGPTRNAHGYALRYHLEDLERHVTAPAGLPAAGFAERVRDLTPPINEDAYPGLMPNVIAARVVQRLDLHGPNMTVDAGRDSALSALATAVRYLRDGEIDLAVVMGIAAPSAGLPGRDPRPVADAALGFVLTRRSTAERHGLTELGELALDRDRTVAAPAEPRDYRGAEGAVALLRALHRGEPAGLRPVEDAHTPAVRVTPSPRPAPAPARADAQPLTAPQPVADPEALAGHLARHSLALHPVPARRVREPLPALPAGTLLLTDDPAALAGVPLPADCLVAVPGGATRADGVPAVRLERPEALAELLDANPGRVHVRVLAGVQDGPREALAERLLDLHDLAFLAAQHRAAELRSYAVLVLDGADGLVPAPHSALFTGLVRSLAQELTDCLMYALVTDRHDMAGALELLAGESAAGRFLPVAHHLAGERLELLPVPVPAAAQAPALPAEPVVVATGGARGLTAHLVRELVEGRAPRAVWLLGSGPAPSPADTADAVPVPRIEALRELAARHPGESPAELGRRHDRAVQRTERARVIAELTALCGPGRVHYRQCDVLDEGAVRKAVEEVFAAEGRVDVLVHGAGLGRSAGVTRKKIADFRAVRDVKVRGHAHLRAAFDGRRPALWCAVSSVSAFIGLRGEPDYGAANEYLMLAAAHARAVEGHDEVAFTSGLWTESGMASADTPAGALLARQNEIGQLTDRQGREFFRTELAGRGSHGLATSWIGDPDWATLERGAPGFRAAAEAVAAPGRLTATARAFLAAAPARSGRTAEWTCRIDLDEHFYLRQHLVDGRPTVPGTFILEIAAEAAVALAPGLRPARITDVVLSRFIRAAEHRWPRTLQVTAERDGHRIAVRVLTPAEGPVPAREHTRMTVHLARTLPAGPPVPPAAEVPRIAPNTYELDGTPVQLSGVFSSLRNPGLLPDGGTADLRLDLPAQSVLDRFVVPSTTLDCLLRTSVLDGRSADPVPAIVPTVLADVRLYTDANDPALAAAHPQGLTLRHWYAADGTEHCALVGPDGRALIAVTGIEGAVRGEYDPGTGTWR